MVFVTTMMTGGCHNIVGSNHHAGVWVSYDPGMPRPTRPPPRTFSAGWPEIQCEDHLAEKARLLAVNIKVITDRDGLRTTARNTGIDHSILSRIISGDTWADTHTLAHLEHTLNTALWPNHTRRTNRS